MHLVAGNSFDQPNDVSQAPSPQMLFSGLQGKLQVSNYIETQEKITLDMKVTSQLFGSLLILFQNAPMSFQATTWIQFATEIGASPAAKKYLRCPVGAMICG